MPTLLALRQQSYLQDGLINSKAVLTACFWQFPVCSGCLLNSYTGYILLVAVTLLYMHANLTWHWLHVGCGYCLALNACECHMMLAAADLCKFTQTYIQQVVHAHIQSSRPAIQSETSASLCMSFDAICVRRCITCNCSFGLSAIRQSSNIFFTNGFLDPLSACIPSTNISETVTVALHGNLSLALQKCVLMHDNTTLQHHVALHSPQGTHI